MQLTNEGAVFDLVPVRRFDLVTLGVMALALMAALGLITLGSAPALLGLFGVACVILVYHMHYPKMRTLSGGRLVVYAHACHFYGVSCVRLTQVQPRLVDQKLYLDAKEGRYLALGFDNVRECQLACQILEGVRIQGRKARIHIAP